MLLFDFHIVAVSLVGAGPAVVPGDERMVEGERYMLPSSTAPGANKLAAASMELLHIVRYVLQLSRQLTPTHGQLARQPTPENKLHARGLP